MMHHWATREEFWGYLATFLHTTQTAPIRQPYLDALLKGKERSFGLDGSLSDVLSDLRKMRSV